MHVFKSNSFFGGLPVDEGDPRLNVQVSEWIFQTGSHQESHESTSAVQDKAMQSRSIDVGDSVNNEKIEEVSSAEDVAQIVKSYDPLISVLECVKASVNQNIHERAMAMFAYVMMEDKNYEVKSRDQSV
jgi:hypothetical protein